MLFLTFVCFRRLASMSYHEYIATIRQGHIGLDSFPYGGCNSVFVRAVGWQLVNFLSHPRLQDLLHSGVPPVVLEGALWRNTIAPAMLRRVGLQDLVATTTKQYVEIATRLVLDSEHRAAVHKRVLEVQLCGVPLLLACHVPFDALQADLDGQLSNEAEASAYPRLFRSLIERNVEK